MKKIISFAILLAVFGIFIAGIAVVFKALVKPAAPAVDNRMKLDDAKAKVTINKEYTFQVKESKAKDAPTFTYAIDSVELRNDIIVKGKKATSIAGRSFFIVNLKLTNGKEQPVSINTSTFIRLSVNGNDKELLAPDIHNDPVVVQPISTKITRVGFPINDTDTNIKLHVGEIAKEKEVIDVVFP